MPDLRPLSVFSAPEKTEKGYSDPRVTPILGLLGSKMCFFARSAKKSEPLNEFSSKRPAVGGSLTPVPTPTFGAFSAKRCSASGVGAEGAFRGFWSAGQKNPDAPRDFGTKSRGAAGFLVKKGVGITLFPPEKKATGPKRPPGRSPIARFLLQRNAAGDRPEGHLGPAPHFSRGNVAVSILQHPLHGVNTVQRAKRRAKAVAAAGSHEARAKSACGSQVRSTWRSAYALPRLRAFKKRGGEAWC